MSSNALQPVPQSVASCCCCLQWAGSCACKRTNPQPKVGLPHEQHPKMRVPHEQQRRTGSARHMLYLLH
jgi:hypothetical protein